MFSDKEILVGIRTLTARAGGEILGVRTYYFLLKNQLHLFVNFKRLRRILRDNGFLHKFHHRYISTTNSSHHLAVAPNLLKRQFDGNKLNTVWSSDITYIDTDKGWLFMAGVLDLATRQLAGFAYSPRMTVQSVEYTFMMAINNERPS